LVECSKAVHEGSCLQCEGNSSMKEWVKHFLCVSWPRKGNGVSNSVDLRVDHLCFASEVARRCFELWSKQGRLWNAAALQSRWLKTF
jgi:hypothetical protein